MVKWSVIVVFGYQPPPPPPKKTKMDLTPCVQLYLTRYTLSPNAFIKTFFLKVSLFHLMIKYLKSQSLLEFHIA